jgi:2-iminobutanoate/2-iminopropanoate deaminase
VLQSAGCTWKDVVKTTIFLRTMGDFAKVNEVYAATLGESRPARSTVAVAGLPKDAQVEIELVAKLP